MAEKLAELPLVLPRTAQELNRAVELISRKVNEIIRTSRDYLDDITQLDDIPGTLDASKLYGNATLDNILVNELLQAVEIETNYLTATQLLVSSPINLTAMGATMPFNISASSPTVVNLSADLLDGQDGSFYLDRAHHSGSQAWATVEKAGSSLADLTTRSAGDLDSGTLADGRLSSNVPLKNSSSTYTASQIFQRTASNLLAVRFSTAAGAFTEIMVDGSYAMGVGGSPRDVRFLRSAAGVLQIDNASGGAGKLHVTGELELDGALNHDGTTVGFYGVTPVARPTLTYSRTGETAAETQLRTALASLGLVLDSTVP